ncbi:hypothetical protein MRX96_032060 [Rhipicephalus microplus]
MSLPYAHVTYPHCVPLPLDKNRDIEDMDTTSTRKRLHPRDSGSDNEGASRKMHAVAMKRNTVSHLPHRQVTWLPTSTSSLIKSMYPTKPSFRPHPLSRKSAVSEPPSTLQGRAAPTGPHLANASAGMAAHAAQGLLMRRQ